MRQIQLIYQEFLNDKLPSKLAQYIQKPTKNIQLNTIESQKIFQAISILFQLINIEEEVSILKDSNNNDGLWLSILESLKQNKISPTKLKQSIQNTIISPVLTAHPTEAKRVSVLEHHRKIFALLSAQILDKNNLKAELERLWFTGEIFLEKPRVEDELNLIFYYLERVFPEAIDQLFVKWINDTQKIYPEIKLNAFPNFKIGNWVGGDRDGHPLVTPEITSLTLKRLRNTALNLIKKYLVELIKQLSISDLTTQVSTNFNKLLLDKLKELGNKGEAIKKRNPNESIRQFLACMITYLEEGYYLDEQDILADLKLLEIELNKRNIHYLGEKDFRKLKLFLSSFGLSLATLDIRQNSTIHEKAIEEILKCSGKKNYQYSNWSEAEKQSFLLNFIANKKVKKSAIKQLKNEGKYVLDYLAVVAKHYHQYGAKAIGGVIVSMTRSVSDLLAVYFLLKQVNLLVEFEDTLVSPIPVVPLLETIEDLEAGPEILSNYLNIPLVQQSLTLQTQIYQTPQRYQQCMIGYSDSNKDGGIIASFWSLQQAQKTIHKIGKAAQVEIYFFHGRGGTISRGAGPSNRFVMAQPQNTINGILRCTEQGETITQKYNNIHTATYNLELLAAATVQQSILKKEENLLTEHEINYWVKESQLSYQQLLQREDFIAFFYQASPIDVIEKSNIGSRPSRRTGAKSLSDLRAIPWVFSWSQSRIFLSGWYGTGSGLEALKNHHPKVYKKLLTNFNQSPTLQYLINNIATSCLTVNLSVFKSFCNLMEDQAKADTYYQLIATELKLTILHLESFYQLSLKKAKPNIYKSLQKREKHLEILHLAQIKLLKQWRKDKNNKELLTLLLLNVNAVAAGLRTTG